MDLGALESKGTLKGELTNLGYSHIKTFFTRGILWTAIWMAEFGKQHSALKSLRIWRTKTEIQGPQALCSYKSTY